MKIRSKNNQYFLLTFKIYPYFCWIIGHFQSHFFAGQNARQKCLIFATFFVENSKVDHESTVQKKKIFPVDIQNLPIFLLNYWPFPITFLCRSKCPAQKNHKKSAKSPFKTPAKSPNLSPFGWITQLMLTHKKGGENARNQSLNAKKIPKRDLKPTPHPWYLTFIYKIL